MNLNCRLTYRATRDIDIQKLSRTAEKKKKKKIDIQVSSGRDLHTLILKIIGTGKIHSKWDAQNKT